MLKRMTSSLVIAAMLMSSGCSEVSNHARTSAVHDGMRALGLAQMPDGTYEFRLCEMADTYTPEMLAEKCINPLVADDGLPVVFNEIPGRPGVLAAHLLNWGVTFAAAAITLLAAYGIGRYVVKVKAINELSRESYAAGLEQSLDASRKYDHFELPEHLKQRLLKEHTELSADGDPVVKDNGDIVTTLTFADKFKFSSGKEVDLRELLENKKLQKSLTEEEAREISELLVELQEVLRSGKAYAETLTKGLDKMSDDGIPLANDGVLGKVVHEHNGRLALNDTIEEFIIKNRPLDKEYHEALQRLDTQVAEVLKREANSLSSQQRNIARLEAAADLDEVLKIVEGVGDEAIVVAQRGEEKLQVLTESSLGNLIEELGTLVGDSSKSADEVNAKLATMRQQINSAVEVWEDQAKELSDAAIDADATNVVRSMESFIKTTRKKTLKAWSKQAKEAKKELTKSFKTPAYETGAKAYAGKATEAVHATDSVLTDVEVKETGEEIVGRVASIVSGAEDKLKLGDDVSEVANKEELLINRLQEVSRRANYPKDLERLTVKTVRESGLFTAADGQSADELIALRDEITAEIEKIIKAAQAKAEANKPSFFKDIATRLRNFKLKDNKIFHYWDKNASSKLPDYKEANSKLAVRVADRREIVARIANHEEVGDVKVEKGIEKLIAQLTGAATFVAIPVTSLRQKLSGHARVSAASRWGNLTGSYELTAEGRVSDMRTIIEGIAEATGAKVSEEVFYFMLRSGLRSRQ